MSGLKAKLIGTGDSGEPSLTSLHFGSTNPATQAPALPSSGIVFRLLMSTAHILLTAQPLAISMS